MDTNKLFQYLGQTFAQVNSLAEENEKLKKQLVDAQKEYDKLSQQENLLQNIIKQLRQQLSEKDGDGIPGEGEISTQNN